eukprot:Skav205474  [mRNA]  locus=scaffold830:73106:77542:+ [translate_table: standard]
MPYHATPSAKSPVAWQLEQAVPGIFAEYWWHRNIHRNAPQQPDCRQSGRCLGEGHGGATMASCGVVGPMATPWHFAARCVLLSLLVTCVVTEREATDASSQLQPLGDAARGEGGGVVGGDLVGG